MNAGIGSPSRDNTKLVSRQNYQGTLQTILYATAIALALPAAKAPAVVFKPQGYTHSRTAPNSIKQNSINPSL